MTKIKQLQHFMARRKWAALEAQYGLTRAAMINGIRNNRRPATLTPDQWEEVVHYREEWHKASNEIRRLRDDQ